MQIVCPHCTTSYAVDAATFGSGGRTVRCARCKETWQAYPEEVAALATAPAAEDDDLAGWGELAPEEHAEDETMPVVESPSISGGDIEGHGQPAEDADWTTLARHDGDDLADDNTAPSWMRRIGLTGLSLGPIARMRIPVRLPFGLPAVCAALGALVLGLVVWRTDVVRLMPQTATFFKMAGLGVNLRGLAFEDVHISTEVVDRKPVLIIEGNIVDISRKPIALPRLRFLVLDEHGTEIYAWNAVLEQPGLNPGDKVWFKSRLASPPAEGREIAVRFFTRQDLATGGI